MYKLVIILFLFFYCYTGAQTPDSTIDKEDETGLYEYDTVLKGGYTILYKTDDSLQYLFLKKGNKVIAELSSTSKGLLHKNLGYVAADFKDHFVLAYSYGSGNPHTIELIRKATGKNIIKNWAAWIDTIEDKEMLLYSDKDVPSANDKMTLLNVKTGQKQFFSFPPDIFNEPQILNRISIENLTDTELVIKYETENGIKKKSYKR